MARRSFSKVWLAAFVVVVGLGTIGSATRSEVATLFARHQKAETEAALAVRPSQPVRVTRVSLAPMSGSEDFTGTIRPWHEAALSFRVPGQLVERLVDVGDRVVAGQVLARLDDTDARLDLQSATAEREAADTDLARARAEAGRSRDLFATSNISQAALDRATSAEAGAASRADRALQAQNLAANRLSYTALLAKRDGIVTATLAEAGQVLAAGLPVVSVADIRALDVVFALPENRRDLLTNATANATLWGGHGPSHALSLRHISPDVDPVGRTYQVRMKLTDPDADTGLGRTVTVHLVTEGGAPVVTLPLAAVMNDGRGPAVWRLPPTTDHVERVPVDLVGINGQVAQVRGLLAEGDLIVSLGAQKIDPARPVRVVETATSPES